ncbi:hypothetical protein Tco_0829456, partial [Tanacetum coccineum]
MTASAASFNKMKVYSCELFVPGGADGRIRKHLVILKDVADVAIEVEFNSGSDLNDLESFIISMSAKASAMVVPIGGALTDVVVECPKNIGSDVAKNLNNSSQAPRGVLVGHKFGFKPVKQVYRHVSKKKKDVESRREGKKASSDFMSSQHYPHLLAPGGSSFLCAPTGSPFSLCSL